MTLKDVVNGRYSTKFAGNDYDGTAMFAVYTPDYARVTDFMSLDKLAREVRWGGMWIGEFRYW